jgi:hypothetical protein
MSYIQRATPRGPSSSLEHQASHFHRKDKLLSQSFGTHSQLHPTVSYLTLPTALHCLFLREHKARGQLNADSLQGAAQSRTVCESNMPESLSRGIQNNPVLRTLRHATQSPSSGPVYPSPAAADRKIYSYRFCRGRGGNPSEDNDS